MIDDLIFLAHKHGSNNQLGGDSMDDAREAATRVFKLIVEKYQQNLRPDLNNLSGIKGPVEEKIEKKGTTDAVGAAAERAKMAANLAKDMANTAKEGTMKGVDQASDRAKMASERLADKATTAVHGAEETLRQIAFPRIRIPGRGLRGDLEPETSNPVYVEDDDSDNGSGSDDRVFGNPLVAELGARPRGEEQSDHVAIERMHDMDMDLALASDSESNEQPGNWSSFTGRRRSTSSEGEHPSSDL